MGVETTNKTIKKGLGKRTGSCQQSSLFLISQRRKQGKIEKEIYKHREHTMLRECEHANTLMPTSSDISVSVCRRYLNNVNIIGWCAEIYKEIPEWTQIKGLTFFRANQHVCLLQSDDCSCSFSCNVQWKTPRSHWTSWWSRYVAVTAASGTSLCCGIPVGCLTPVAQVRERETCFGL